MSKLLKNIVSIPVIYTMFALLFIIADIVFGVVYHYISCQALAAIPIAIIWIALQCLVSKYLLRKLVLNKIYYLISQILILGNLWLLNLPFQIGTLFLLVIGFMSYKRRRKGSIKYITYN